MSAWRQKRDLFSWEARAEQVNLIKIGRIWWLLRNKTWTRQCTRAVWTIFGHVRVSPFLSFVRISVRFLEKWVSDSIFSGLFPSYGENYLAPLKYPFKCSDPGCDDTTATRILWVKLLAYIWPDHMYSPRVMSLYSLRVFFIPVKLGTLYVHNLIEVFTLMSLSLTIISLLLQFSQFPRGNICKHRICSVHMFYGTSLWSSQ